jgi:site-specific DNA-methyltransferase (adenine-specific)
MPFYNDESVVLYHGNALEIMPALDRVDAIVTDPPYAVTHLEWDRWPAGWPALASRITDQLWCFGSLRMFLERAADFAGWRLAQDVVWEKHNGSNSAADRFRRVHELAASHYVSKDGGPRHMRSVIRAKSCHGYATNETQKPEAIVTPLVAFSVPPGGVVLDPFAGSGTTLVVARQTGRRAIGIELRREQCEDVVRRLAQIDLGLSAPGERKRTA